MINTTTKAFWAMIGVGILFTVLTACVSTTTGGAFSREVDVDKAVQSHLDAANQYLRARDTENAGRHLRSALDLDPDNPNVHGAMAYSFELTGDIALAEAHHKKALKAKGELKAAAQNNYGIFLLKQGRFKEACHQLKAAADDVMYRNRSAAFSSLGLCRLQLNEPDDARYAFERALSIDRTNSVALIELVGLAVIDQNLPLARRYYDTYRLTSRATPRSLLLGMSIAETTGDKALFEENAEMLEKLFPRSVENQSIKERRPRD